MPSIFQTPRLRVRRYTPDDAEQAFKIYSDAEVMRFLGTGSQKPVPDVDAMRKTIVDRWLARYEKHPGLGVWAAECKDMQQIVGSILLVHLDEQPEIEVGWHLGRFAWGNGYATEGGRGAVEYAFDVLGLDRIVCVVHPQNEKSLAVARRIGLKHEGRRHAYGQELEYFSATRSA